MAEPTKLPVKREEGKLAPSAQAWRAPFQSLRREIDRLFDDFDGGLWSSPFHRGIFDIRPYWLRDSDWAPSLAMDIVETAKSYEVTAELPGLDEKHVEVKVANGCLVIKGEKQQETEEKKPNYYMHEREFGAFERSFRLPEGIDAEKIDAKFAKGVLTVSLPKTAEAQKTERRITIKAA